MEMNRRELFGIGTAWAATVGPLVTGLTASAAFAQAQSFPSAPVKLITQGAPASGPDVVARIVFDDIGRRWKQQVVILNATGAGGSIAAKQAVQAPPDGYTLYLPAASAFIVMPEMFPNLKIDMVADFSPVGFVAEQPMVICVSPDLKVSSIGELAVLSKVKPGSLNFAANARGANVVSDSGKISKTG